MAAIEGAYTGRSKVSQDGNGLSIVVRSHMGGATAAFLFFWLIGWTAGGLWAGVELSEKIFAEQTFEGSTVFLAAWMGCWMVGELSVAGALLWGLGGAVTVTITSATLNISKHVFGFGPTKTYSVASIRRLRAEVQPNEEEDGSKTYDLQSGGSIVFDYGQRTVILARQLDQAEAIHLVSVIASRNRYISLAPEVGNQHSP